MSKLLKTVLVILALSAGAIFATAASAVPYLDGYGKWRGYSYTEEAYSWLRVSSLPNSARLECTCN